MTVETVGDVNTRIGSEAAVTQYCHGTLNREVSPPQKRTPGINIVIGWCIPTHNNENPRESHSIERTPLVYTLIRVLEPISMQNRRSLYFIRNKRDYESKVGSKARGDLCS